MIRFALTLVVGLMLSVSGSAWGEYTFKDGMISLDNIDPYSERLAAAKDKYLNYSERELCEIATYELFGKIELWDTQVEFSGSNAALLALQLGYDCHIGRNAHTIWKDKKVCKYATFKGSWSENSANKKYIREVA